MSKTFSVKVVSLGEEKKQIEVQVSDLMQVRSLREAVAQQLRMTAINIRLSYKDRIMEDASKLAEYDLQANTSIYMGIYSSKPKVVNVTLPSGENVLGKVFPTDSVGTFLGRFKRKYGTNSIVQLSHGGTILQDSESLNIVEDDDDLQIIVKVPGGKNFSH